MRKNRVKAATFRSGEVAICDFTEKGLFYWAGKNWRRGYDTCQRQGGEHMENGKWFYIEHRHYDYNAIEDPRPGSIINIVD